MIPTNQFQSYLFGGLLVATRISGLIAVCPVFASAGIPVRIKAGLVIGLTFLVSFSVPIEAQFPSVVAWSLAAVREATIGAVFGLALQFVMDGLLFAGQLLGLQMGFSLVNLIDPQTQVDTPVLSVFHQLVGSLIFLELNVHHWVLRALTRSFQYLPLGSTSLGIPVGLSLLGSAGKIFLLGLQISGPVLLATLTADFALGFIGKASPQLPVLMIGLSVKNVLGLVVAISTLVAWPRILEPAFGHAIAQSELWLRVAH